MTTPLATIADALIEFILSLLRDPEAAAEFEQDPEGTLAANGLSDICADDVRAVAPVVVERHDVHPHPNPHPHPPGPKPTPVEEINTITQTFTIDNRATIVDQSVNQNIWANGDVNQIFDNEAIVNSGDYGAAAGETASVDTSTTDIDTGDIAIGNETTDVDIDGSFNDESTNTNTETDAAIDESFNSETDEASADVSVDESFNDTSAEVDNTQTTVNNGNVGGDVAVENEVAVETASVESDYGYEADTSADFVEEPMEMELEEQP
ncbi:MAG: hypothetical protein CMH34_02545 [Microbacterium sp.]|nr:hypothetical protein [Microbacterium sp.]